MQNLNPGEISEKNIYATGNLEIINQMIKLPNQTRISQTINIQRWANLTKIY